jgi:DNA repair protein RadD
MGVQSVHKKAKMLGGFDLLLIDEVHLVGRDANSMYGKFIASCREIEPDMRICGLSATPFRLSTGYLHQGDDAIFHDIVYEADVRELIDQGYLSDLVTKATTTRIDTRGLHIRGGEYIQSELDERACIPEVVAGAAREIVERGQDRAGWIAFCTGVKHAQQVRDAIRLLGVSCETITGETPTGERDRIIRAFKAKQIRCLTSVGVLTTGFDAPHCDLIALLRPTMSPGLYVQMIGRGMRLADGKRDCLILDMASVVRTHGPIDDIVVPKQKRKSCDEPTVRAKECPECGSLVGLRVYECPDCAYQWEVPSDPKHDDKPDEDAVLFKSQRKDDWLTVTEQQAFLHHKHGSQPSIRIEYRVGRRVYKQWVCLNHSGIVGARAVSWWNRYVGKKVSFHHAENYYNHVKPIHQIQVRKNGQYWEVTGWKRKADEMEKAS